MSEQQPPAAFAAVLTDPTHPLIVGGQAVNLWAEIYSPAEPEIGAFAPLISKDADIHGDRGLAAIFPRALADSPHEKSRRFAARQLPLLAARLR